MDAMADDQVGNGPGESRFDAIFQAESDCVKVLDGSGRILRMNPAGLGILEADSPSQVIGRPLLDFIVPQHHEEASRCLGKALQHESVVCAFEIVDLHGRKHWMESHMVSMSESGASIEVLAVTRDVTREREAATTLREREEHIQEIEARLREAQKMEALGTMASGIAHDFNNLLVTIIGNVEMARMYAPENQAVVARLDQSLKAAARAGDLVRQILQFEQQGSDLFVSGETAPPQSPSSHTRLEPARAGAADAVPHGNGEAVLYVDDEAALCHLVEVTLRRCGYNGVTTTDPEEAVALFRAQPQRFAAVISDYTMPKMTGLSVAEEIKKIAPGMPVILTTGVTSEFDSDLARSPYVDAVVSKPFTMQALAVELAKWIAASRSSP